MKSKLTIAVISVLVGLFTSYLITAKYVIYAMDKEFESTFNRFVEKENEIEKFSETYYQGQRQFAPSLEITQWVGKEYSLEKLKGRVVLLDFWGIRCGPCVAGMPKIQRLHEKYKDNGLTMIAVHSSKGSFDSIADFVEKNNYSFSVGIDSGGTRKNMLFMVYLPII